MYFTIREKNMKQLFLIRHNHKYKPSKGENGLVRFLHADVNYTFLGGWWDCFNGSIISKLIKTQYFGAYFFSMKHKSKQKFA